MLEHLALSESGFLFDARTGSTYSLNRTGTFVLRELMAGTPVGKIAGRLLEAFEVDAETAARDVEQILFRLKFLGVIPEEGAK
jgi:hypothetical protein